jgi:hypothetical protein
MVSEVNTTEAVPKVTGYGGLLGSRKHDLVYVNLPKAGCTTIKNFLYYLDNGVFYGRPLHIHFDHSAFLRSDNQPIELLAKLTRRAKVFTFIREPTSRIISCYNEKIHHVSRNSFGQIRAYLIQNYGLSFPEQGRISLDNHIANFGKFLEFVTENIAGRTPIRLDYHWLMQHRVLKRHSKKVVLEYIGIVETFERDFSELLFSAGIRNSMPFDRRFNEGPADLYSREEIMTPEIKSRLMEMYSTDMEFYQLRRSIGRSERRDIPD